MLGVLQVPLIDKDKKFQLLKIYNLPSPYLKLILKFNMILLSNTLQLQQELST